MAKKVETNDVVDVIDPDITVPDENVSDDQSAYSKQEQKHYKEIRERASHVQKLADANDKAKREASAAKHALDDADEDLRDFIRKGPDAQMELPLEEESPWRDVLMSSLSLDPKIVEKLTNANLDTIGKIADHTVEYELTDIEGIGPAKAELIQHALDDYWKDHPADDNEQDDPVATNEGE
jgi:hypothetical protein